MGPLRTFRARDETEFCAAEWFDAAFELSAQTSRLCMQIDPTGQLRWRMAGIALGSADDAMATEMLRLRRKALVVAKRNVDGAISALLSLHPSNLYSLTNTIDRLLTVRQTLGVHTAKLSLPGRKISVNKRVALHALAHTFRTCGLSVTINDAEALASPFIQAGEALFHDLAMGGFTPATVAHHAIQAKVLEWGPNATVTFTYEMGAGGVLLGLGGVPSVADYNAAASYSETSTGGYRLEMHYTHVLAGKQ